VDRKRARQKVHPEKLAADIGAGQRAGRDRRVKEGRGNENHDEKWPSHPAEAGEQAVQGEIFLPGETNSLSQPGGTIFLQYSSTRRKNEVRLKMRDGPRSQRQPNVDCRLWKP